MDYDIVKKEQSLPVAHDLFQRVATVLIAQNALLRIGVDQILLGTRFVLAKDILRDATNASAFADELPVLFLMCDSRSSDEYVKMIGQVKAQCPMARVVILVDHMEPPALMQACGAGMDGLCLTGMSGASLIKALELVMLGQSFIPGSLALPLLSQTLSGAQTDATGWIAAMPANDVVRASKLSLREVQILHHLTQGASNKHIARDLEIAEATVKVHVKAVLRKVKVANRTQAAIWAQEHLRITVRSQLAIPGE
jgi:two-component system, NarL family, nitrate/nitrite response regulator NarL